MNYNQRMYRSAMAKKHAEQKKIKEFANSKECEDLLEKVREKAKPSVDIDELPF